ncbi:SGNH/GDSL hydrolase family protein [Streptomyces europaeiscabiei]|uniref:SGNH/GDSL hydrolase family protein n=1 Tax=Streptomyces europaeiscabiei TaxID=146819 RepID=A0ABU4NES0_9ACTN|nr:SGNH/GDSL hydrolase family protein [Streptomyces europaeiscabiei]MDX2526670.1 SGNH/GDSL hydrolase family protein [Streptomyces europaeiscabiei]MDX2771617.1 SGNH/GDSL hydrolase family protein [Streptomyces europaeiscabiei]MDX3541564.1 SGNH/GDSL hydrolase family protein [Streptomyces europaeiscabiei]MDX3551905.1 SGNH/GDSL hydrolase family protein [Streptomyces europaeiscabiei]MDX3669173.1 SGNH/GDSL hydrolase family protein [Streptomyces europaeiscabiei]
MTRQHGCALLAAIAALVVAISAAIYTGVGIDDGTPRQETFARAPRSSAAPASTGVWVGAWAASPSGSEPGTESDGLAGHSVRNVVHTTAAGTSARVTLSNLYGQQPLTITHASLAVAASTDTPAAAADTMRRLTFAGNPKVVIAPGQQVVSDAVRVAIPHDSDVLITTYSPTPSGPATYHAHARQISYTAEGDRAEDVTGQPYTTQSLHWRYVTALDVLSNESDGTVVVLGDSLTDGVTSTVGENRRWTDVLSGRLRAASGSSGTPRYSVANEGISGNRVLTDGNGRPAENPSGLSRFQRDVLGRTGVKAVVIDLGVNDILKNPGQADPAAITAGLRRLVEQAHARGLRVVGATLMPFHGHRGYSDQRESVRQAINATIRSGSVFDAYVDFDKALRDPYAPRRLRPDYDSGDHLHPSDKGYEQMAEVFDLEKLKGSAPAEL